MHTGVIRYWFAVCYPENKFPPCIRGLSWDELTSCQKVVVFLVYTGVVRIEIDKVHSAINFPVYTGVILS